MPTDKPDMIVYTVKLPRVPYQSDIAQRRLRVYVNKALVSRDEVGIEAVDYKLAVPQDSDVTLVLVHQDDAKPEPNESQSEPYSFVARDLTPPASPVYPFAVEYVGELDGGEVQASESSATTTDPSDGEDSESGESESTNTTLEPETPSESTEELPPLVDTDSTSGEESSQASADPSAESEASADPTEESASSAE